MSRPIPTLSSSVPLCLCGVFIALLAHVARADPTVENAMDVTLFPTKVEVVARVSMEQVLMVENAQDARGEKWKQAVTAHALYLLKHLQVKADDKSLEGKLISADAPGEVDPADLAAAALEGRDSPINTTMALYRFEYPLAKPPQVVRLTQNLLVQYEGWQAAFVLRMRQFDEPQWQLALLPRHNAVEFGCEWKTPAAAPATTQPAATQTAVPATGTAVPLWPTLQAYFAHGVHHIVGDGSLASVGWDHLLFVGAILLAVKKLWELLAVVTAFTLAHTLTLTLSVVGWVNLSEKIFESMIAASIVAIAMQNVLFPRQSSGKLRYAIVFAFGLFHGLGFAGELKEAMSGLPPAALGTALAGFSAGVEIGHQMVVLPLFALLFFVRDFRAEQPRSWVTGKAVPAASILIGLAGVYFLVHALK